MRNIRNKKGFTLIEILIVIVILGVVAGLAIPVLTAQVERSRAQEAIQHLGAMKQSMVRYFASNGTYATATVANLDYNPNAGVAGQVPLFNYAITAQAANTFTLTAQRLPAAANAGNTVTINETGTITRNGAYV